jgi:copper chaperone CopZ
VKAALLEVPGVRRVEVDFGRKEATVIADKGKVGRPSLIDALSKHGYQGFVESK